MRQRLTTWVVALGTCVAMVGGAGLVSAQQSQGEKGRVAAVPKTAVPAKAPVASSATTATRKATTARPAAPTPPPTVHVGGTVTDDSGAGWPLYARVGITSDSTEPVVVFSDPVTGAYGADLFDGVDYTFVVTAVGPGYVPGGGPVTTAGSPIVQNWALEVDAVECKAPGYSYPAGSLFEPFSTGKIPPNWEVQNLSGAAHWTVTALGDDCGSFAGNDTGGSGPYAIVNSQCHSDLETPDDTSLVTPSLNMSSLANVVIQWNTEFMQCTNGCERTQVGDVDVSTNGGTSWTNVWEAGETDNIPGPSLQSVDISGVAAGQANVKARFRFQGFWAGWWQVDNVLLGDPEATCTAQPGGLIVGNVLDANLGSGVNDGTVTNLGNSSSTKTFATPEDDGQPDGFYILFAPAGSPSLLATKQFYGTDTETPTVVAGGVVRQDFVLTAGQVDATPRPLSAFILTNGVQDLTLNLTNTGTRNAAFQIFELNVPPTPSVTQGFATAAQRDEALALLPRDAHGRRTGFDAPTAKALAPLPKAPVTVKPKFAFSGGDVLASYPTDLDSPWGVGFDGAVPATWLSEFFGAELHQFLLDGTKTGATIDISSEVPLWAADGTFNTNTGMMWYVSITDGTTGSCIVEVNPATRALTGNTICPGPDFSISERGLAYDPATDTYFMGSFIDKTIYHFDSTGTILDSKFVELNVSGLTYFAKTGHLFVMVNDVEEPVTVLDANNNYAVVGTFQVADDAFGGFSGAGMEADCDGHLWMVNQNTQTLYEVDSGEENFCSVDIPWLTESPTTGTIAAALPNVASGEVGPNPFPVTVTFNSTGLLPGLRRAQLKVKTDTPYATLPIPVDLTVLFNDVPVDSFAYNFIYGAAGAGIMRGCDFYNFCPDVLVTRAAMAGYIERAIHGPQAQPPVYQGEFQDVFFNAFNANYIQGLVDDQITAGCSLNPPLYCPNAPIPREQMAVFILLGKHGSGYVPPDCETPIFDDVPCDNNFAPWVNELYNEGITAGCSVSPALFCPRPDPNNPVPNNGLSTNAQMAVFMSVAFDLPHVP